MNKIFIIVRDFLINLSSITKLSYNEINIIVYYFIIPFIYLSIIDFKIQSHVFKISFVSCLLILSFFIKDFKSFSDSLFMKSVDFLNLFDFIGCNYIVSSVIICVVVPVIILILILVYYPHR